MPAHAVTTAIGNKEQFFPKSGLRTDRVNFREDFMRDYVENNIYVLINGVVEIFVQFLEA
jgi:hypothetical protein